MTIELIKEYHFISINYKSFEAHEKWRVNFFSDYMYR